MPRRSEWLPGYCWVVAMVLFLYCNVVLGCSKWFSKMPPSVLFKLLYLKNTSMTIFV